MNLISEMRNEISQIGVNYRGKNQFLGKKCVEKFDKSIQKINISNVQKLRMLQKIYKDPGHFLKNEVWIWDEKFSLKDLKIENIETKKYEKEIKTYDLKFKPVPFLEIKKIDNRKYHTFWIGESIIRMKFREFTNFSEKENIDLKKVMVVIN